MPAKTSPGTGMSPKSPASEKSCRDKCRVCDAPASYRHFGYQLVCKSCASFFRRTVALMKAYKCKTRGKCSSQAVRPSIACKSCRFRKCIAAGMSVTAVVSSPGTKGSKMTPLDRLVQARKAVYINRLRETSEFCAHLQVRPRYSLSWTTQFCAMATTAEFLVLCDFLRQSGIIELFVKGTESVCTQIASLFMPAWTVYEWMCTSVRNFGHSSRRLHFFHDESYLDSTEAVLSEYYGTDPDLRDPYHLARLGVSLSAETLETACRLAHARLDDVESAVLTLILFARSVKDLKCGDRARLGPLLDSVFHRLEQHYRHTYKDYALRLYVIVQMADEVERLRRMFDEHVTILSLNGKKSVVAEAEDCTHSEHKASFCAALSGP